MFMNLVSTFSFAKQVAKILQCLEINFYDTLYQLCCWSNTFLYINVTPCVYKTFTWDLSAASPSIPHQLSEWAREDALVLQIIDINWTATQICVQLLIRCVRTKPDMFLKGPVEQLSVWKEHKEKLPATLNWLDCFRSVTQVFVISSMLCRSLESH